MLKFAGQKATGGPPAEWEQLISKQQSFPKKQPSQEGPVFLLFHSW